MKLRLQTKCQSLEGETYFEYKELEIENFRWEKDHKFSYIPLKTGRWLSLKANEEIVGLGI